MDHRFIAQENRLKLEDLRLDAAIRGIVPDAPVTVVGTEWHGFDALTLIYRPTSGRIAEEILCRHDEARLDKPARNEDLQAKLGAPGCRCDLVICDEAHKMSATFFGGEVRGTRSATAWDSFCPASRATSC